MVKKIIANNIDTPPLAPRKSKTTNTSSSTSVGLSSQSKDTVRNDGWESALKGMGGKRDSRASTRFSTDAMLPKEVLNDLYTCDGLIRRIVDLIPEEIFRVPGKIQNDPVDEYDEGLITHEMNRLNSTKILKYAKEMARLTGGAIIYIGAMGAGSPDTELDYSKITNIEFLKVFDLNDIKTSECIYNTDMLSPNFGKIEVYKIQVRVGNSINYQDIHASRCIPFYGASVPPSSSFGRLLENRHWGISILQYMYPDIRDFRIAFGNTAGILGEFIVGKYKFSDLDEILASGNEKKLQGRMSGIEASKSLINAVMLGTDEDYSRDSASVSGLSDLLDRFMMLVASSTGYPVTKLFGRSASGLNATGEGDQKSYYDMIRTEMVDLQPYVQQMVDVFVAWKKLPTNDYTYEFGNLYQPTAHEEADRERVVAETLRTNMDGAQRALAEGVLSPKQVYNLYYRDQIGEEFDESLEVPDTEGVDDEAIISTGINPQMGEDEPTSTEEPVRQDESLEISDESGKGIIQWLKTLFSKHSKESNGSD